MEPTTTTLEPRLQNLVDHGISGTDIMHGELKNLMLEAENMMLTRSKEEHKQYWKGLLEAYSNVYSLTYQLAFAINERTVKRESGR